MRWIGNILFIQKELLDMFMDDYSFGFDVRTFLKYTSYSYLSCADGYWRNGEGNAIEICDMGKRYLQNCIRLVDNDRKGLSTGLSTNIKTIPDEEYSEMRTNRAQLFEKYEEVYEKIVELMDEKVMELRQNL